MAAKSPDATSSDYEAMLSYWNMVETILGGAQTMRDAGETYLPKFPNETAEDYEYRRANAKFTNIYADIVSNLASKPFAEEVTLKDGATERFEKLAEDIDGLGNNLNVFAAARFFDGINYAIDWIFVEFTKASPRPDGLRLSLADERNQGLRPYWVHVPAKRMLAAYTAVVRGKTIFVHARMREDVTERDGFDEVCRERIRVLNREPIFETIGGQMTDKVVDYAPATYELWERVTRSGTSTTASQWAVVESDRISIGVIPLAPFITGRRKDGSWQFVPPMQDAAYLQIEHYQQETALKSIKELTAFPMLAGNGVQPAMKNGVPDTVPVGPRAVLFAPPTGETGQHGEWTFIEPSAESLNFLAKDVEATEKQLRELGRQPLTATAGITVVTAALASQKASSAVQAWSWALKDALEQAFVYTAMWLNMPVEQAPEVSVFSDFALETNDEKGPTALMEMRKNGDLSRRTLWAEHQRRGILSGDFDAEDEEKALEAEMPDPDDEEELAAANTPGQRAA
jgi:hypothetical protein